jgi:hypothetical protein
MKRWRFIGTGILTIGTLAGAAWAAQPSKGDMDFCNQKAAQVSKATPVKPGIGTTRPPSPQSGATRPVGASQTVASREIHRRNSGWRPLARLSQSTGRLISRASVSGRNSLAQPALPAPQGLMAAALHRAHNLPRKTWTLLDRSTSWSRAMPVARRAGA